MPVLTHRRAARILVIVAASVPLLLAGGAALISVLIGQSCSGGTGLADSPSQVAQRNIPASFLAIYESVGARYHIPWEVLAGIGAEECDHGRNPDPSCTPQPGARGPGVANCAGASGPMQIGVAGGPCGTAGAGGVFAGKCIYVAEHIGSILPPGTSFNAGDTLATAYPGPDWTEWGWAKALDTPSVTWMECGCTEQDNVNAGGRAFARFLRSLGATTGQDPGPGPMYAGGSC